MSALNSDKPALRADIRAPAPLARGRALQAARRRDPSPSRWRYRLDRLLRRASVRFAARRLALPLAGLLLGAWAWGQDALWTAAEAQLQSLRAALVERPEFAVTRLEVTGGGAQLRALIAERIGFRAPVSSLDLDLDALRREVEAAPGVAEAKVNVTAAGALRVAVVERVPAALWRWEGQLHLVDREGVVIAPVARRAARADLPLIVGAGANRAVPEALALHRRAAPLRDRLRALVRVGDRRWDVVLTGPGARETAIAVAGGADPGEAPPVPDQVIYLPAEAPESALARALALDRAEDLLDRDIAVLDLRDPARPTLRLHPRALTELLRLRAGTQGEDA